MSYETQCAACLSAELKEFSTFNRLYRITSDSRIWPQGGRIGQCRNCGLVQKIFDENYYKEIHDIYDTYNLYFQGIGEEQKIFKQGQGVPRSVLLVDNILPMFSGYGVESIKWLDFGCGRGHLLKVLAARQPEWKLYGADMGEKNRSCIESISGVCQYYANGIDGIDGSFNVFSMCHVIEHIPDPISFLDKVHKFLLDNGFLVIVTPNWRKNPIDLLVADHCLHCSLDWLNTLLSTAGFEVFYSNEALISKELIVVARVCGNGQTHMKNGLPQTMIKRDWDILENQLHWLTDMAAWAKSETKFPSVGILGTALAATWVDASCRSRFDFFVEEDNDRAGCDYLDRPVFLPDQLHPGLKVLVPLPAHQAKQICRRLNGSDSACFLSI
jgi:2-polyprenyl-3-methyl-5-hydroxy-6-metoxy-1,4-benzoquinol methylase